MSMLFWKKFLVEVRKRCDFSLIFAYEATFRHFLMVGGEPTFCQFEYGLCLGFSTGNISLAKFYDFFP